MVRFLRECEAEYRFFGTLTVGADWSSAEDFRAAVDRWLVWFLRAQRSSAGGDGSRASIFWFVEFQERGAPHLHIFYTHFVDWYPAADAWGRACLKYGFCSEAESQTFWKTSTKFETLRGGMGAAISYARKYAAKEAQKEAPEGYWKGRFWGVRGLRSRDSCHVVATQGSAAVKHAVKLEALLEQVAAEGLLRKFAWEEGAGAVYSVRGGVWSDLGKIGAQIELLICRMVLALDIEEVPV
jgi:hypothetical protein